MQLKRINSAIDRVERNKINENFDILERTYGKTAIDAQDAKSQSLLAKEQSLLAEEQSKHAIEISDEAMDLAESVQEQFNQVVIEGDSSVEAAQARVSSDNIVYDTLKARLDTEKAQVTQQLTQINVNVAQPPYNASVGVDVTDIINQAIIDVNARGGGKVFIPYNGDQPYYIDAVKSIKMLDNVTLEIDKNATLQAITADVGQYAVIDITDVVNVSIIGGKILGDKVTHAGTEGEWGHGIRLHGSKNVRIADVTINDCWGDAIELSSTAAKGNLENIIIERFNFDNNRRQGISVCSANGVKIRDGVISNTGGVAPSDGICIEPFLSNQVVQNLDIENVTTINNSGSGIKAYLSFLIGTDEFVSINVKNHHDYNSEHGFRAINTNMNADSLNGLIKLETCVWENDTNPCFMVNQWSSNTVKIESIDCTAIFSGSTAIEAGFYIGASSGQNPTYPMGNVHLLNPSVITKPGATAPNRAIYLSALVPAGSPNAYGLGNISVINPITLSSSLPDTQMSIDNKVDNLVLVDDKKVLRKTSTSDSGIVISKWENKRYYDNSGATGYTAFNISQAVKGQIFTFTNKTNNRMELITSGNSNTRIIKPLTSTQRAIYTTQNGASITIRVEDDAYYVLEMIGKWEYGEQAVNRYETGIWTPSLNRTDATYTEQTGTYTLIGNRVFINATIRLSVKGTSSAGTVVTGLPFAQSNTSAILTTMIKNLTTANQQVFATGGDGGTGLRLETPTQTYLPNTEITDTTIIKVSGHYTI